MPPTRIHHINFIVRDLEEAMARFGRALAVEPFEVIDHRPRGARVARTRVGESWLVLVSPYDPASVPGRYLARHGEGFFLLSFGVDNLDQAMAELAERGALSDGTAVRPGIFDWQVADLETEDDLGVRFHLTQIV